MQVIEFHHFRWKIATLWLWLTDTNRASHGKSPCEWENSLYFTGPFSMSQTVSHNQRVIWLDGNLQIPNQFVNPPVVFCGFPPVPGPLDPASWDLLALVLPWSSPLTERPNDNKKDLGSWWEHDHYIDSHHQQSVQQKQEFAGR